MEVVDLRFSSGLPQASPSTVVQHWINNPGRDLNELATSSDAKTFDYTQTQKEKLADDIFERRLVLSYGKFFK